MPITDMFKDPETGKIKTAWLIGGGGIAIAGVFMLMGKSSGDGGVTSPGQSGANTDALAGLGSAILGLAGAGGGGGSGSGDGSSSGFLVNPSGGITTIPVGTQGRFTAIGPTIGGVTNWGFIPVPAPGATTTITQGSHLQAGSVATRGITTGSIIPRTAAVAKPSNSGLSGAPVTSTSGTTSSSGYAPAVK